MVHNLVEFARLPVCLWRRKGSIGFQERRLSKTPWNAWKIRNNKNQQAADFPIRLPNNNQASL